MSNNTVYVDRDKISFDFIRVNPGDWVVIKPNLVKESKETDANEWRSVITDASLIKDVCSHVCEKLCGEGRVTICDAPQTDSSFEKIAEKLGLYEIAEECSKQFNLKVEVIDLRDEEWTNDAGVITKREKLQGDPEGSIAFNLGKNSLFYQHSGEGRFYGADYDSRVVNNHHKGETQEYLICATPVKADVFINMPKLKTHKKTGVTLNLKNLVGINADKNWLPHHTEGSPSNGGDEFPDLTLKRRIEQLSVKFARKIALNIPLLGPKIAQRLRKSGTKVFGDGATVIRSGNWFKNNTTWRMVLDLNRCLLYGNADGSLRKENKKRYYCVIDGRIGMEGMGPMQGDPVESGIVIGGTDPVLADMVAARIMGFDWRKIPVIKGAFALDSFPITDFSPDDVYVESNIKEWNGRFVDIEDSEFLQFKPHFGWAGHIEYHYRG